MTATRPAAFEATGITGSYTYGGMKHYLGIDGGGTRTTLALADENGRELARRSGPAGIVDPRRPLAAAESVVRLARELLGEAGLSAPVEGLCAGLAGTGDPVGKEAVREALAAAGVARHVVVCSDGEVALEGAFVGGPGVLLVAGTGSVAWGRGQDGRVERCGGWGMIVGDEGSAYWLGREAMRAMLWAHDGRGTATRLLDDLLGTIGVGAPELLPAWAARAPKDSIAALSPEVVRLAVDGDEVAGRLLGEAARGLAEHGSALMRRLGPWPAPVPVVFHGGLATQPCFAEAVVRCFETLGMATTIQPSRADAVSGALRCALMA